LDLFRYRFWYHVILTLLASTARFRPALAFSLNRRFRHPHHLVRNSVCFLFVLIAGSVNLELPLEPNRRCQTHRAEIGTEQRRNEATACVC
jgi:hypothetical protein